MTFKTIFGLASVAAMLLIVLPIAGLVVRAIDEQAWQSAMRDPVQMALVLSLRTSLMSVAAIVVLGTPLAYALSHWQSPWRRWANAIVELPIVMPPAVAGLGLLMTFGRRGVVGQWLFAVGISLPFTTTAVIIAQIFVAMPYYVRTAQVGFRSVPRHLEEAARVDGAGSGAIFWYVVLPMARRAMLAGVLLSWARALGEFGATILFAGSLAGETQTMPLLVYTILEQDLNAAIWTALLLIGGALVILLFTRLVVQKD